MAVDTKRADPGTTPFPSDRTFARLYALVALGITAVTAACLLGTLAANAALEAYIGVSLFTWQEFLGLTGTITLVLFATVLAPLLSVAAVYAYRARKGRN